MGRSNTTRGIFTLCIWISRFALLNILWIIFTLLGFILFGMFPATTALLATTRQLIKGNEPSIARTFFYYYKKGFLASNKIGLLFLICGLLLYFHFVFAHAIGHAWMVYSSYFFISIFLLITCHTLSSFIEYEQPIKQHIKNGILACINYPLSNLTIIFGITAVYLLNQLISGTIFFFSISLISLAILSSGHLSFKRLEMKKMIES